MYLKAQHEILHINILAKSAKDIKKKVGLYFHP